MRIFIVGKVTILIIRMRMRFLYRANACLTALHLATMAKKTKSQLPPLPQRSYIPVEA